MFKKLMASLGSGSAKVETKLYEHRVMPGGILRGEVQVIGGEVKQEIEEVSLFLMTQIEVESGDHEHVQPYVITREPLARDIRIHPHERFGIPFELHVHLETPVTQLVPQGSAGAKGGFTPPSGFNGKSTGPTGLPYSHARPHRGRGASVWLHTGMEIDNGVDATDRDYITVEPTPAMYRVLAALENLGFAVMSADVEKGSLRGNGFQSTIGFYQEIEYRPYRGRYSGRINELELSFVPRTNDTGVLIEVDSRFSSRDSYRSLLLNHRNYERIDWERELTELLDSTR